MAKYSAINLLDKLFIFRNVFKSFPEAPNTPHLYLLLSVRALNKHYRETNKFSISLFLRANGHSSGFKDIDKAVQHFVSVGFLITVGKNGRRINITTRGKMYLNYLESRLRVCHFRYKRAESGRVKPPGPKKGTFKSLK